VEDRIKIFERVEAGVVAEGALGAEFVEVNVALENDFGGGGNFEIDGLALHQFDWLLAEEASDEIFLDVGRRRDDGGESDGGVGADSDGDFHFAGGSVVGKDGAAGGAGHKINRRRCRRGRPRPCGSAQHLAVMLGSDFLALPVHAGGVGIINLHSVTADVALAGLGVAGDYAGQSDEAAGVLRPAFQDGKPVEREIVAADDFFAGAGRDGLGKEFSHLSQHGQHFYFVEKALRGFHVHEGADAVGDFV